jgi:murein L,D-transpeptidase YcbB/YkuD
VANADSGLANPLMVSRRVIYVALVAAASVVSVFTIRSLWSPSSRLHADQRSEFRLKLQNLLNTPAADRMLPRFSDRSAVLTFYRSRDFAPIWMGGGTNDRMLTANAFLSQAASEGLDPDDYKAVPAPPEALAAGLALAELSTTAAVVRYARHVQFGRIDFSTIDYNIQFEHRPFDVTGLLGKLAAHSEIKEVLGALSPPLPQYRALKNKLAQLRAEKTDPAAAGSTPDQVQAIIANMERWRWFPRDLGNTNVIVNIPQFRLTFVQDRVPKFTAKVVVGEPALPSPVLSATMTSLTLNPTWNLPDQMVEREILPRLRQDPHLLERLELKTERRADGTLHVYQLQGDSSVVGRVRFNFPNRFFVYQHDTPDQNLFQQKVRAYSHGCIRVENAIYYAGYLLASEHPGEQYPPERLYAMFGDNEIEFGFPKPIPVHLTYQTAYVDDDGALVLLPDIYGLDSKILAALKEAGKHPDSIAQPSLQQRPLWQRAFNRLVELTRIPLAAN